MSRRRRLRLSFSSDEEDDEPRQHHHNHQHQSSPNTDALMREAEAGIADVTLESSTTVNPNPNDDFPSPPIEVSDDDVDEEFIDVSEDLSPPSAEDPPSADAVQPPPATGNLSPSVDGNSVPADAVHSPPPSVTGEAVMETSTDGAECLVSEFLKRLGLRLRSEWMSSCLRGLESSVPGFENFSVDRKAEICFGQFLMSDMNYSGGGVLPDNVADMHLVDLAGPFVLQVDEIVNIRCPLRQRYHKAAPGNKRCLKLSMTDGIHGVFGMEYRPLKDIDVVSPAGIKVVIRNVHVRRGLLMLVPEVIDVLGGMVEELEAARQRLVAEVDKPPRGRRPRLGDVPPLATRATRAAWSSAFNDGRQSTSNSIPQNSESVQTPVGVGAQGHDFTNRSNESGTPSRTIRVSTSNQILHVDAQPTRREQPHHSRVLEIPPILSRATPLNCPSLDASYSDLDRTFHSRSQRSSSLQRYAGGGCRFDQALHPDIQNTDVEMTDNGISRDGRAASRFSSDVNRESTNFNRRSNSFIDVEDINTLDYDDLETDQFSNLYGNTEDTYAGDGVNHPQMLSVDQESPFTYLANLSAKLSAAEDSVVSVKGKIKCFLTGVKGFEFKERSTFELRAYIDDGSLISEILIDHSVVQNKIGYSPMEVNADISSSDAKVVSRMKEIIKQFRLFLIDFEGAMTVELKRSSPTPVAIEMNQGCPSSDAWLLLRRVKTCITVQTPRSVEPIILSP